MCCSKKINGFRKPKIVFFGIKYFPSKGGTSRVAENLIKNLNLEFDITLYCYKHSEALKNIENIEVIQIPEIPLGNFGVYLYFLFSRHLGQTPLK